MKNLQVIKQQEVLGKDFKIYGDFENPLFLAKDVAEWIEHSNTRMLLQNIDEDEKLCVNNPYALKGQQEQWFLTENGLYEVLMQSRKPIAKAFKKEVKKILKSIRQTGGYIAGQESMSDAELMAKALLVAQAQIERKDLIIQELQPKALFADAVSASEDAILVSELAKILTQNGIEIGEKRLFLWLRENGYLIKRKGNDWNLPTQRSMQLGLFQIKKTAIQHSDGSISISKTPKVTGKGQQYFVKHFTKLYKQSFLIG